jgi:very-short-patch-repair endonuclease
MINNEYIYMIIRGLGIPQPVKEFKFCPTRRWRIDFAWPDHLLALEIEGGIYTQGRHTRGSGFQKDIEKYNELTLCGWKLLRSTPRDFQTIGIQNLLRFFEKIKK